MHLPCVQLALVVILLLAVVVLQKQLGHIPASHFLRYVPGNRISGSYRGRNIDIGPTPAGSYDRRYLEVSVRLNRPIPSGEFFIESNASTAHLLNGLGVTDAQPFGAAPYMYASHPASLVETFQGAHGFRALITREDFVYLTLSEGLLQFLSQDTTLKGAPLQELIDKVCDLAEGIERYYRA
jgi:hypothetical protein